MECDDGNVENGDGCDEQCHVEANFSCLYGDSSTPSICSYNGEVTFNLIEAAKVTYKNEIIQKYKLSP